MFSSENGRGARERADSRYSGERYRVELVANYKNCLVEKDKYWISKKKMLLLQDLMVSSEMPSEIRSQRRMVRG